MISIEFASIGEIQSLTKLSLSIITEGEMTITRDPNRKPPPMHPGEILREEFMGPSGLSAHGLAMALHVPSTRISEIVNERRSVTADTAYRLALYFGTSADLWMNLQASYELACIERDNSSRIKNEVQRRIA